MRLCRGSHAEGKLRFQSWERDGQKRSKLSTIADRFFEPLRIFSRRRDEQLRQWAKRPMLPKTEDAWQQVR